jgi:DNA-binding response OmpR family regulator
MDHLKCILVADDEEDLTWSISKSIGKNDKIFEVICVNNGDSALEVLSSRRVDLVISDLRMPGRNGLALLHDIQRDYPDTRVIIMTAHSSEALRQEIARSGTPYYIEKPFDLRFLRKLIYEALDITQAGFEGMLVSACIRDMIEYNCQIRRTSAMRISNGSHSGVIHFNKGEIVHAECGELVGENALFSILDWEKGNFAFDPMGVSGKRTIQTGWRILLNLTLIE